MGHHNFSSCRHRSAFTLKELLIVVGVFGVLAALFLPSIQKAREDARRNQCQSCLKQIGMGFLNFADKRKYHLPPISSNIDAVPDIPGDKSPTTTAGFPEAGSAPSPGAGYSWFVFILPEMGCDREFQSIAKTSSDFTQPAFSSQISVNSGAGPAHPATVGQYFFNCPSFSGGTRLDTSPRTAGVPGGAVETGTIPPNYVVGIAAAGGAKGATLTNYNAILGTHIDVNADKDFPARSASLKNSNNGLMAFRGKTFDIGRDMAKCQDGTSKTAIVAETRERRFSSWYDGTMNWVVGARHSDPSTGTTAIVPANITTKSSVNGMFVGNRWCVGVDGTSATGGHALNYGPTKANPTAVYLPTAALSDPDISGIPPGRLWGPSSEHRDGIVNHLCADGHVAAISDSVDGNIYLWYITYQGGEPMGD